MQPEPDPMRVIAAGFQERAQAEAAERDLRARLPLGPDDVSVGDAGGDAGAMHGALLGGRFRSGRLVEVEDVVSAHDGQLLADVPEAWTGRAAPGPEGDI